MFFIYVHCDGVVALHPLTHWPARTYRSEQERYSEGVEAVPS
jgi:hypothetical protein